MRLHRIKESASVVDETISFPLWLDTNPLVHHFHHSSIANFKALCSRFDVDEQRVLRLIGVRQRSLPSVGGPSHAITDIAHPLPIEVRRYR